MNIKINRNTLICGKCIENNCENIFSKTFRNMVLYKAICKNCITKYLVIKRKKLVLKNMVVKIHNKMKKLKIKQKKLV